MFCPYGGWKAGHINGPAFLFISPCLRTSSAGPMRGSAIGTLSLASDLRPSRVKEAKMGWTYPQQPFTDGSQWQQQARLQSF